VLAGRQSTCEPAAFGSISQCRWYLSCHIHPGATGLPGAQFATPDKALDARTIGHNPERLSLLQGGIVYANQVTSVRQQTSLPFSLRLAGCVHPQQWTIDRRGACLSVNRSNGKSRAEVAAHM
jgi:hypothetical protein